jgi:hypothetical protein
MTWKKKVSKSNVVLFQLAASVLGIKERESGLLHTPTATANQGAPSMYKRDQGSWGNHMYPTPTTQDSRIGPNNIKGSQHRKERGNPALADKVLFPTPTAACEQGGEQSYRTERTKSGGFITRRVNKPHMTYGAKLSDAMLYLERKKMYPTPKVGQGSRPNGKGGKVLEEEVMIEAGLRERGKTMKQMYPTPVAKDNCTESLETWEKRSEKHKAQGKTIPKALRIQVQEENKKIYNTPTTNDHKNTSFPKSQKNRHSIVGNLMQEKNPPKVGGRLNPQFVQFLMGYPIDWTKIE